MILVSACLLGHKVKYNGGSNPHELLIKHSDCGRFVAVCPECAALLPVPRPPIELLHSGGRKILAGKGQALDREGRDVTSFMIAGAQNILKIAEAHRAKLAILKESSPSCGVHTVYDGTFSGKKIKGPGVAAALLQDNGVRIFSEKDLTEERLLNFIAADRNEEQKI